MEVQQQRLDRDPGRTLISIKADKALYLARQALHRMIAEDGAGVTAGDGAAE